MLAGAAIAQLGGQPGWPPRPLQSPLVVGLELVTAGALIAGAGTRLAALLGVAIVLTITHGVRLMALVSPGPTSALMMLLLTVFVARAGRLWGLDAHLAARWPRSPLW